MNLGKFVRELFPASSQKLSTAASAEAPGLGPSQRPASPAKDVTPINERPHLAVANRLNTQEMRRMLSQLDFAGPDEEASQLSDSQSSKPETMPFEKRSERFKSAPRANTTQANSKWDMEPSFPRISRLHTKDLEQAELELLEHEASLQLTCKQGSHPQVTSGFQWSGRVTPINCSPTRGLISFQNARNKKELKCSDSEVKRVTAIFNSGAADIKHGGNAASPIFGNNRDKRTSKTQYEFRKENTAELDDINALDEEMSRADWEQDSCFGSADVMFGKASLKGFQELKLNQDNLNRAKLLLEASPEKDTPEAAPIFQIAGKANFSGGLLFGKASHLGSGFSNQTGILKLTEEDLKRAEALLNSPVKEDKNGLESSSNMSSMPISIGFGKASGWGQPSFHSTLQLSKEALANAEKLFDDDQTFNYPEQRAKEGPNHRERGMNMEISKPGADSSVSIQQKARNPFTASSNTSKGAKPSVANPKRSGPFKAPRQLKAAMDLNNPRHMKTFPSTRTLHDPDPLGGLVREHPSKRARLRETALTGKVMINFDKYKQMSLLIAKRYKQKGPTTNLAHRTVVKHHGCSFLTTSEIFDKCLPLLQSLNIRSSQELVREITAELRLQTEKYDQTEEYVEHHLQMLSRKYIDQFDEVSTLGIQTTEISAGFGTASTKYSLLSSLLTDLYCRYKREEYIGSKSILRQMREGIVNQERRVCLMVKSLNRAGLSFKIELTDGWYVTYFNLDFTESQEESIINTPTIRPRREATNKELILRLILLKKLKQGDKVEISNLGIPVVAPEKLDEYKPYEPFECTIHYNSLKKCPDQSIKMGLLYTFPKPSRLDTVHPNGGPVPLLDMIIVAKKGIKVVDDKKDEYLTYQLPEQTEVHPTVSFSLVVIDSIHICTEYASKPISYHELQIRFQPLPIFSRYEVGNRIELSNYKVKARWGSPHMMNYKQQFSRGLVLQEQKRNCIIPKELPKNPRKTVPLYALLMESRIAHRYSLQDLVTNSLQESSIKSAPQYSLLSIAARYISHGKTEALFHIYKYHFLQIRYIGFEAFKAAQANRLGNKGDHHDQDTRKDSSAAGPSNAAQNDEDQTSFWKNFEAKLTTSERTRVGAQNETTVGSDKFSALGEHTYPENSYANPVFPGDKHYFGGGDYFEGDRTRNGEPAIKVADPVVVFFDLVNTGSTQSIELSKNKKIMIHQFNFELMSSFALGSSFISDFCEKSSFEKFLLGEYYKHAKAGLEEFEGGYPKLFARLQQFRLG